MGGAPASQVLLEVIREEDLPGVLRRGGKGAGSTLATASALEREWSAALSGAPSCRSDQAGRFAFSLLDPGKVLLVASHQEASGVRTVPVKVAPGEDVEVRVDLERGLEISGKVLLEDGAPVAGAQVRAAPSSLAALGAVARLQKLVCGFDTGAGPGSTPTVRTEADGKFFLPGVSPEPQDVTAWASGGLRGRAESVSPGGDRITITLVAGGVVSGRLRSGHGLPGLRVTGVISLPSGEETGGAVHAALRAAAAAEDPDLGPFAGELHSDGVFRVSGLPRGIFRVCLEAPGYRPHVSRKVEVNPGDHIDLGLVDLIEDRAITGTVRSNVGRAVPGIEIVALPPGAHGVVEPVAETLTEKDGTYRLEGLPEGVHDVEARSPEWAPARLERLQSGACNVDFLLSRGLRLEGKVIDARTQKALVGVEVVSPPSQRSFSDEQGHFELRGLLARPRHGGVPVVDRLVVTASLPGYTTLREAVAWPPPANAEPLTLSLERGLIFRGRALTPDGEPVSGASVRFLRPEGPPRLISGDPAPHTTTGPSGELELETDGDWEPFQGGTRLFLEVRAASSDGVGLVEITEEDLAGATDGVIEGDVIVGLGSTVAGRVLDTAGQAARGAKVALYFSGLSGDAAADAQAFGLRETLRTGAADAEGRFSLGQVPPGDYRVEATGPGAALLHQPLSISANGKVELLLQLTPGRSLGGAVRGPGGKGLEGIEVVALLDLETPVTGPRRTFLAAQTAGLVRGRSGAEGVIKLSGLPAGALLVVARAPGWETQCARVEPDQETVDLLLRPTVEVRGKVIDKQSGEGVTGCSVDVIFLGAGPEEQAREPWNASPASRVWVSSPDGSFEVEGVPMGGPYELRVESSGHLPLVEKLEIFPDLPPLSLQLEPGLQVSGVVRRARSGEPIAGAEVTCSRPGEARRARSAEDGTFLLKGLKGGEWTLSFYHCDHVGVSQLLQLDQDISVGEVELAPAARLEIVVEGLPLRVDVVVTAEPIEVEAAIAPVPARPLGIGCFELGNLPAGDYRIVLAVEGAPPYIAAQLSLAEGACVRHVVKYAQSSRKISREGG